MLARLSILAATAGLVWACGGASQSQPSPSGGGDSQPGQPNSLYVDVRSGRDTNNGRSPGSPFRTLNKAASVVQPGWTVFAMDGTYTSDGTIEPLTISRSGTKDAWITFTAAPGQHPVIQIPRGAGAWAGIHLLGVAYVIIDGFEVVGQNGSITEREAAANDGTQAVLNENCIYVDGMGYGDVHPAIPHDIIIRNSILHDCSAGGIQANVADALTIEHNTVYNTSWWTIFGSSGIALYHLTDAPESTTTNGYKNFIVGNRVYNNRNNMPSHPTDGNPPAIYDGNGIIVDDARHSQPPVGVHDKQFVPYTGRTYIANNIVHDNGGRGIHAYSSNHVDIVNNTAYNNVLSSSPHIEWAEIDAYRCSDVNLLNNVAINLVGKDVNTDDGNRYDYNVWDAARVPTRGPHDVVGAALLTDPAKGNFAPAAGSPALRSGTSTLAPADDFYGNPRPAGAIDRGAIQVSR
jgi:parallel beta-helix repeat protein